MAEEEEEYESDPEQAKLSLKMRRRREASDDEEEEENGDFRVRVSDGEDEDESDDDDGQGAAADYDDDDEYDDLIDDEEEEEVEVVREEVVERGSVKGRNDGDEIGGNVVENEEGGDGEGEGKKENEPFAVPTAGAFYMHDDRFRGTSARGGGGAAAGRHRMWIYCHLSGMGSVGGKFIELIRLQKANSWQGKLWELRDDRKWGHDKFEELTQERHYDEGRRGSRGRNRGRGRSRGEDRGVARGNRPKVYNNNNQTNAPKSVRGRGPRRYQPSTPNNYEGSAQSKQSVKPIEKTSYASSGRASAATSTSETAQVPVRKNLVASNLNSASPPFYPSGSSNKETNITQKKDAQSGALNRGPRPSAMADSYPISQPNNIRGRNAHDSLGMDKLYIDDSVSSTAGKPLNNLQSRVVGRGSMPFGQVAYQPVPPHHSQVNRVPNQLRSNQQYVPRLASGSRASSPPKKSVPIHAVESTEIESSTESNDSKTALVGKGKGSIPSSGMSAFSYASLGGNQGDQNFSGAPTFLPVMQFAGQHAGGLGVPAVGMAFPGYVGQPNGMGNSEMTWLPVLAGAAGALGTAGLGGNYPYITMDGAYHPHPSGQPSSLPPPTSKDNNANKVGSEVKPSQRPELANDELRHRQNKARRYTEMKFDK